MFENKEKDSKILVCACHNIEHQIMIYKDEDEKEGFLTIHLKHDGLWKRIKNAIKYIFGYKSMYGDFDEFFFKKEHADALIDFGNFLKESRT